MKICTKSWNLGWKQRNFNKIDISNPGTEKPLLACAHVVYAIVFMRHEYLMSSKTGNSAHEWPGNKSAYSMQNDGWLVLQTNKSVIRAIKSMVGKLMTEA